MEDSILDDIKKLLGIAPDYTSFDADILLHINSTLNVLTQLGIGPPTGFMITGKDAKWGAFIGSDTALNMIKTYIFHKVKLAFDPPSTPHGINAIKDQATELEWRINVHRESTEWVDPDPNILLPGEDYVFFEEPVIDGGVIK